MTETRFEFYMAIVKKLLFWLEKLQKLFFFLVKFELKKNTFKTNDNWNIYEEELGFFKKN